MYSGEGNLANASRSIISLKSDAKLTGVASPHAGEHKIPALARPARSATVGRPAFRACTMPAVYVRRAARTSGFAGEHSMNMHRREFLELAGGSVAGGALLSLPMFSGA